MEAVYVQFSDANETTVVSSFSGPQDTVTFPNQGVIDVSDPRWLAFVDPSSTLAGAKAAQAALIKAACAAQIVGGFTSSSLGSSRGYPSQDTDQRNLQSAALAAQGQPSSWSTPIWCSTGGTWALTPHTAAQVQQVIADWLAYRVAAQQKYAILIDQINAATTVSAVQALVW